MKCNKLSFDYRFGGTLYIWVYAPQVPSLNNTKGEFEIQEFNDMNIHFDCNHVGGTKWQKKKQKKSLKRLKNI